MLRAVSQSSGGGNAETVTVIDSGADTTTWVLLAKDQTGNQSPATDAGITYNANTNALTVAGAISGSNLSGTNTGDQTATTLSVTDTSFEIIEGTTAQAAFKSADNSLYSICDDMVASSASNNGSFTFSASGAGTSATARVVDEVGHAGINEFQTGTTNAGEANIQTGGTLCLLDSASGATYRLRTWLKTQTLPTGAEDYHLFMGYTKAGILGSPIAFSGIGLYLSSSYANFQFMKYSGGSPAYTDTTVPANANTWYDVELVVVTHGTAASVAYTLYINGVSVATGTGVDTGSYRVNPIKILKFAGGTERTVLVDKYFFDSRLP